MNEEKNERYFTEAMMFREVKPGMIVEIENAGLGSGNRLARLVGWRNWESTSELKAVVEIENDGVFELLDTCVPATRIVPVGTEKKQVLSKIEKNLCSQLNVSHLDPLDENLLEALFDMGYLKEVK